MEYLVEKGLIVLSIEHPFFEYVGKRNSTCRLIDGDGSKTVLSGKSAFPFPMNFVHELVFNLRSTNQLVERPTQFVIAVDPLNVTMALVLKKLGRVKKVYFHSVDYSERRFGLGVLNAVYELIYRTALRKSDLIGVVSERMRLKVVGAGVPTERVMLLPNAPVMGQIAPLAIEKREPASIVHTGITYSIDIDDLLLGLSQLKGRIPTFKIHFVGGISFTKEQKQTIATYNLEENIVLHGYVSYHENLEIISTCMIGLTYYDKSISQFEYGDSLKIREYAALGLPTVSEGITWTAEEGAESGAVAIFRSPDEMADRIFLLMTDARLYRRMSESALRFGKRYDKRLLLAALQKSLNA